MDKKKYIEELRVLGEEVQRLEEKNCPTNPSKWSYYKSQAKQKFDVYPSAYANGWASKQYKAAGGGWKQCAGESVNEAIGNLTISKPFKSNDNTFEKVYGIFDKKDYFNAKGLAKTQIGNFERALQRNDKGAQEILDKFKGDMNKAKEYITQVISDQKKAHAFEDYKALKGAIDSIQKGKPEQGAVNYVKRIIHNNNQKYSIALYSELRGKKFNNYKDIHADVDSLIGESVNEGVINELSADTYKNTVKAALQRGDSKGNSIAVKALQSFGKAIAKELAGKSFEVAGARGINLAKGFYRGDSKKFINQFQMTFTGEGDFIESRNVKVFGSDEAHFYMKVEFQVPNNMGGWSTDLKFKGYEKYKFPGSIQFSIKQGNVWVWYKAADTSLEFTRVGAREMAKLADIIVTAMDFPTKAKHNTIKQFDPMKVSNESVNEGKKRFRQQDGIGKAKYTISYHDGKEKHKDGSDFFGIQIFKNKKDLETFRKSLLSKGYVEESVNEAASRTAMEIGGLTGMNKDAIQKFVDDNKLDIEKVYQYVKNGKLPERMALVSAIAGKPGNTVQTKLIKKFK